MYVLVDSGWRSCALKPVECQAIRVSPGVAPERGAKVPGVASHPHWYPPRPCVTTRQLIIAILAPQEGIGKGTRHVADGGHPLVKDPINAAWRCGWSDWKRTQTEYAVVVVVAAASNIIWSSLNRRLFRNPLEFQPHCHRYERSSVDLQHSGARWEEQEAHAHGLAQPLRGCATPTQSELH
jgi:hypothetical protein